MSMMVVMGGLGCGTVKKTVKTNDATELERLCDEFFYVFFMNDPYGIHQLIPEPEKLGFEDYAKNMALFDCESLVDKYSQYNDLYNKIKRINRNILNDEQKITYDCLEWITEVQVEYGNTYLLNNYLYANENLGSNISQSIVEYEIDNTKDVEIYFEIIEQLPPVADSICSLYDEIAENGYTINDKTIDGIIEQYEGFVEKEDNIFEVVFEEKIDLLDIESLLKEQYIDKNKKYVNEYVFYFYNTLIDELESIKGTRKYGDSYADMGEAGKKYYETLVKEKTSSNMTPDEVAKYLEEFIVEDLYTLYYIICSNKNVLEEIKSFNLPFESLETVIDYQISHMNKEFVKCDIDKYIVSYLNPICEIDGVLAYYMIPKIGDVSVNRIRVNKSEISKIDYLAYYTLAHEGVPGHMYQYTGIMSNGIINNFRKLPLYICSSEGWAEYAAKKAGYFLAEDGFVSQDAIAYMNINERLSTYVQARVDIGIQYEGWKLADISQYIYQIYRIDDMEQLNAIAKVMYDQSLSNPGNFLPYAVGSFYMDKLELEFEDHYGKEKGSVEFHKFIVKMGNVPLHIYDKNKEKYFEEKKLCLMN